MPAKPGQEFKRGIAEVSDDRLVLATSGAQAAQFVLPWRALRFLPLYGRDALGLTGHNSGIRASVRKLIPYAV